LEKSRLEDFMNGFAAAVQLLSRAGHNGFLVEYVCLATSVIDSILRIGIILKHQIKNQTDDVLDEYLHMEEGSKIISERDIYRFSLKQDIIDEELFALLNNLYDKRNRVVHRYIISDITTRQVLDIGIQYEKIISTVSNEIAKLEEIQVEIGVGICVAGPEIIKSQLDGMIAKKHGNANLAKGLS
jgi:uncharacterized protein YutE (UPF0331/DUF86 family)